MTSAPRSPALIRPDPALASSYRDYIAELGDEERYPFPLDFDHADFPALLQRLDDLALGIGVPDGFVRSSTFWLVEHGELVGVSNLRHTLNDRLRDCGGHIGLGIRPSCRGRGLGDTLMRMTIQQAHARGIGELHVHCHKRNAVSARMIVANGGVLQSEVEVGTPAEVVQRFVLPGMARTVESEKPLE